MAGKPPSLYTTLPEDSSSDEEVPSLLKLTTEERHYNTIPGSSVTTMAALSHSNPKPTLWFPDKQETEDQTEDNNSISQNGPSPQDIEPYTSTIQCL